MSDLRPSGLALVNGRRVDVVTRGDYIKREAPLVVKAVEGARVVVVPAPAETDDNAS